MQEITFFEFVWGLCAMCGYAPIAIPLMMTVWMIYEKIVEKFTDEEEDEEDAEGIESECDCA